MPKKKAKKDSAVGGKPDGTMSVKEIREDISKSFEDEIVQDLSQRPTKIKIGDGLSWGCPSLNYVCTGNPFVGIIKGRSYEIFGTYSSGKTTTCLHAIAEAQRQGEIVAFIDAEQSIDVVYTKNLGVSLEDLIFIQPTYGEQALEVVLSLIDRGVRLIVVDSVAALVPLDEAEASMEKSQMGLQARMMGKFLRKVTPKLKKSQSSILLTNQTRQKIGVVFGDNTTTPGGTAIKFFASVRLKCFLSTSKKNSIRGANQTLLGAKDKERLGSVFSVSVPKNKVHRPFLSCEIPLYYGIGLDYVMDWYNFAEAHEIIKKGKGAYIIPMKKGKELRVKYDDMEKNLNEVIKLVKEKYK